MARTCICILCVCACSRDGQGREHVSSGSCLCMWYELFPAQTHGFIDLARFCIHYVIGGVRIHVDIHHLLEQWSFKGDYSHIYIYIYIYIYIME
jgi:hypothetical protein